MFFFFFFSDVGYLVLFQSIVIPVTILYLVTNSKPVIILGPGLYAGIPVHVLQVAAGEEGGPGGLLTLPKEKEMKEDEEEKKEDNDNEEEMERKRRDKGGYAGQPGGGRRHDVQIPLGQLCHLSPSPAAPALRFFLQGRS